MSDIHPLTLRPHWLKFAPGVSTSPPPLLLGRLLCADQVSTPGCTKAPGQETGEQLTRPRCQRSVRAGFVHPSAAEIAAGPERFAAARAGTSCRVRGFSLHPVKGPQVPLKRPEGKFIVYMCGHVAGIPQRGPACSLVKRLWSACDQAWVWILYQGL